MITAEDVVHAPVVVKGVILGRNIVFEHGTVTIARRLIVLVVIQVFLDLHLVGREEVDRRLLISRIVPLFHGLNQLVFGLD